MKSWHGTRAASVDEAAARFIEAAADTKAEMIKNHELGNYKGRTGVQLQFAAETTVRALDMAHEIITGETLPEEYRLGPGESFWD